MPENQPQSLPVVPIISNDSLPAASNSPRKKINKQEKDQVIELLKSGMSPTAVARQLDINGHTIAGVLAGARKAGRLPPKGGSVHRPSFPQSAAEAAAKAATEMAASGIVIPATITSASSSTPIVQQIQQQPAQQPSAGTGDDFMGGRPVMGTSGGFNGASPTVKYTVERIVPPDGLLGTHTGSFTSDDLGNTYGEGQYKITKHEAGKPFAIEYVQKISPSFGPARFPGANRVAQGNGNRPFLNRGNEPDDGEPRHNYRYSYQPNTNAPMEKAIDMMAQMHDKSLNQIEAARKGGPDNYMATFLKEQQETWNQRWEMERRQKEAEKKEEEAKWQRSQEAERERHERDQKAERERHERELDRIKTEAQANILREREDREARESRARDERKFLLDLEDKKLALVRQEAEAAQKRLEAELSRSRDEMKSLQEKTAMELRESREFTASHIEESQKAISDQFNKDREGLDREHKLRERALDKEHELNRQILDIQKEGIQNQGGDHLFSTINTVIKEFSKGLTQVVDLKKLEVMTPEAQAAAIAQGSIQGNVQEMPSGVQQPQMNPAATRSDAAMAQQTSAPQPSMATASAEGAQAVAKAASGIMENRMETMIKENMRKPFFQEILKEWALHVESGSDPTTFANLYLEMMKDPVNGEGRQACAAFATFMRPRNWKRMYAVLKDNVDAETRASFELSQAEAFYEGFKAMVIEQIREYWEQFLAQRQAQQQGVVPEAVAPQVQVETQSAPAAAQSEPEEVESSVEGNQAS